MRLEDDAIVLRPLEEADAPALVSAIGDDPDLDRWTQIPFPYTEEHARAFISTTDELALAILDRGSGELLGGIGTRDLDLGIVEVGYWVLEAFDQMAPQVRDWSERCKARPAYQRAAAK